MVQCDIVTCIVKTNVVQVAYPPSTISVLTIQQEVEGGGGEFLLITFGSVDCSTVSF